MGNAIEPNIIAAAINPDIVFSPDPMIDLVYSFLVTCLFVLYMISIILLSCIEIFTETRSLDDESGSGQGLAAAL